MFPVTILYAFFLDGDVTTMPGRLADGRNASVKLVDGSGFYSRSIKPLASGLWQTKEKMIQRGFRL